MVDLSAASRMARDLLQQHGLDEWNLGFDRAKRRAGCCHFGQKVISLSVPLTRLHPEHEAAIRAIWRDQHDPARVLDIGRRYAEIGYWEAMEESDDDPDNPGDRVRRLIAPAADVEDEDEE